jgi:four helix bundle protein
VVWKKALDLVIAVYRCAEVFPKRETYGLISQLRRAAVSVPSNIAEGHSRISTGEFRQFLKHALGSLVEIETQIEISHRLGYVHSDEFSELFWRTDEIGKMLTGLLRSLPNKNRGGTSLTL